MTVLISDLSILHNLSKKMRSKCAVIPNNNLKSHKNSISVWQARRERHLTVACRCRFRLSQNESLFLTYRIKATTGLARVMRNRREWNDIEFDDWHSFTHIREIQRINNRKSIMNNHNTFAVRRNNGNIYLFVHRCGAETWSLFDFMGESFFLRW